MITASEARSKAESNINKYVEFAIKQIENKILAAVDQNQFSISIDSSNVSSSNRSRVKSYFERLGYVWKEHCDQRDGDYIHISW